MQYQSLAVLVKNIPGIHGIVTSDAWQSIRYRMTLAVDPRRNAHFTQFLRLPTQYEALAGPVMDFLLSDRIERPLKITVLGCSNGAEVYSIASVLHMSAPAVQIDIGGYDIVGEAIEKAKRAEYESQKIFNNNTITQAFVNETFTRKESLYNVKADIAANVHFDVGDVLDPALKEVAGASDIVYAQNVLVHLKPSMAIKAFRNIHSLLKPRAALFIDGMDLGMKVKLTRRYRLIPLEYEIEKIHNEARKTRGYAWPYMYWGLEPYVTSRRNSVRRYATIFYKADT